MFIKDPEDIQSKYYYNNKQKVAYYQKQYSMLHRERLKQKAHEYYIKHKKQMNARSKQYNKKKITHSEAMGQVRYIRKLYIEHKEQPIKPIEEPVQKPKISKVRLVINWN